MDKRIGKMALFNRIFMSVALMIGTAAAQEAGWQAGQVNATMCQWKVPRGG
jgi:hypothetical protein